MINLLPSPLQKEIRAAYSNTLLLRYVFLLLASLGFLLAALGLAYFTLIQAGNHADKVKTENEQQAVGYQETEERATKFRAQLASAKTLFEGENLYSKTLVRLSALFPDGTAVGSLDLGNDSFSQPATLMVQVRDRAAAEALQQSFTSSPYVTNVSLGNISTNTESSAYPYTIELHFTLNRSIAQ